MTEEATAPWLSLVIPAYNEAARLPTTLDALAAYFAGQPYGVEVLVVDDGSADATAAVARARAATWPAVRLLTLPHRGKGSAVRAGVLAARGEYILLCDADLSMPIAELGKFLPERMRDRAIAIASREGPGARRFDEPFSRHLMGRVFNLAVRLLVLPGIQDSQCGFKCLRGEAGRALAAAQTLDGWGFDVEWLALARHWGWRIAEVPILWYCSPSSRVRPLRDSWAMLGDVLTVRRALRRGRYPAAPVAPAGASEALAGTDPHPWSLSKTLRRGEGSA
ncbi:MAG TPA: dolichyl-phosphate beta-glucosyltransferase [Ktedonobacterales bacterium]|nr:dolichyl-phosphate beta-glucosyltransferase [Ktedonobacterales bacterium]